MVLTCIVVGCKSEWFPKGGISFHVFPTDPFKRKQWLDSIIIKGSFYPTARICSLHFKESDYVGRTKRLKSDATPFFEEVASLEAEDMSNGEDPIILQQQENLNTPETSRDIKSIPLVLIERHGLESPKDVEHLPCLKKSQLQEILEDSMNLESTTLQEVAENLPSLKKSRLQEILEASTSPDNTKLQEDIKIGPGFIQPHRLKTSKVAHKAVQAKIRSKKEVALRAREKLLNQTVKRQRQTINKLKSLVNLVKSYTDHSEIENILKGNFAYICKEFKKKPKSRHGARYSDEVIAFALRLHFYSSKAYDFLQEYLALPHAETLKRKLTRTVETGWDLTVLQPRSRTPSSERSMTNSIDEILVTCMETDSSDECVSYLGETHYGMSKPMFHETCKLIRFSGEFQYLFSPAQ